MSDLPATVHQAGLLFQQAMFQHDPAAMQHIIDWGYAQIEIEYPADPIRAPLNLIRRLAAQKEWRQVIRTSGRQLRGTIAAASVKELEFQLQRRRDAIVAADNQAAQERAVTFTQSQQIKSYTQMKDVDFTDWRERSRLEHEWREAEAAAESRRRMDERIQDTSLQISVLLHEAVIKSMGTTSADKIFAATDRVNAKVLEIRRDANLTPDEKHLQIKTLLDTLPMMLRNLRPNDV